MHNMSYQANGTCIHIHVCLYVANCTCTLYMICYFVHSRMSYMVSHCYPKFFVVYLQPTLTLQNFQATQKEFSITNLSPTFGFGILHYLTHRFLQIMDKAICDTGLSMQQSTAQMDAENSTRNISTLNIENSIHTSYQTELTACCLFIFIQWACVGFLKKKGSLETILLNHHSNHCIFHAKV